MLILTATLMPAMLVTLIHDAASQVISFYLWGSGLMDLELETLSNALAVHVNGQGLINPHS